MNLRTFEVMQQLQHYDLKDINCFKVEFEKRVLSLNHLKEYAFILHDKDFNSNGDLKAIHFHLVVSLKSPANINTIGEVLRVETQYINKIKTTTKNAFLYLIHFNDKTKYQYSIDEVVANFDYNKLIDNVKFNIKEIINKIATGDIRQYNLTKFVDCENYTKYKKIIDNAFNWRYQKLEFESKGSRDMKVIFISGESGAGKTTSAKNYCNDKGFSFYISSGGKNLLDDYKGQDCIILDDLRDTDYKFNDLLKMLDNNTCSNASARYFNKSLNECKLLIITSCKPIEEWYQNLLNRNLLNEFECKNLSEIEQRKQFFRRISLYMDVSKEVVKLKTYDSIIDDFKIILSVPNEMLKQYEEKEKDIKEMISDFSTVFKKSN